MLTYITELLMAPSKERALKVMTYLWEHPGCEDMLTKDELQVLTNAVNAALAGYVPPGDLASVH